jgi:Tfp pilus assembly protein PilF
MQNSERLLLVFAGFFFGTIFGGLLVRELTRTDVAPAGPAVDPAAMNGPVERGSDGAGGGNQPGMEAGGANSGAVMAQVKALLEQYKKTPDKFESQLGLGQLYLQKGDYAVAAEWFEKARKQQPKNLDVLMDLGLCRINLGDTAAAEKLFQEALVVKPDLPEALFALASVAWGARGDAAGANGYLDRLEKQRPGDADAAALRARIRAGKKVN